MHCDVIPHNINSDQGKYFIAREMQQWTHTQGFFLSNSKPHHPEAIGLKKGRIAY